MHTYMVAPRPGAFHEQMPWLVDMDITGEVWQSRLPTGSDSSIPRLYYSTFRSSRSRCFMIGMPSAGSSSASRLQAAMDKAT